MTVGTFDSPLAPIGVALHFDKSVFGTKVIAWVRAYKLDRDVRRSRVGEERLHEHVAEFVTKRRL